MSKTEIWDALAKTDPAHTKKFKRAGGFQGTSVKPIYMVKRMTEQFGPVGTGWGMDAPEFETIPAGNELLVFCTVRLWVETPEKAAYGVGGDKVVVQRSSGPFVDDEAFKKAYTDALSNAMKFLGMAADVHMGQHDDDKYVAALSKEFGEPKAHGEMRGPLGLMELKKKIKSLAQDITDCTEIEQLNALIASSKSVIDQCERDLPVWYFGQEGSDVTGLQQRISERVDELQKLAQTPLDGG